IPGSSAGPLHELYRNDYIRFRPHLTVINLGHNASDEEIGKHVPEMIRLNRVEGIGTVLVKEANCPWLISPSVSRRLQLMERLAAENHVPLLDLNGYFADPAIDLTGFIWWDKVHFTDLGHRKAALWLAPRILELLLRQPT
ncbi:MAG TPA: SGNH/GDSL hydrolase family protein, partial [Bdellovibrionota bacterium]|nr:SGNH/GDSL hydrolase family protein [Bdellovibrionota bacterium]